MTGVTPCYAVGTTGGAHVSILAQVKCARQTYAAHVLTRLKQRWAGWTDKSMARQQRAPKEPGGEAAITVARGAGPLALPKITARRGNATSQAPIYLC